MDIIDKFQELNDDNLVLVVELINKLHATQNKSRKKTKVKPKSSKTVVKKERLKPQVIEIEEEEEDDWEVLPAKKKKKVRPNKFLSMPEYDMGHEDQSYLPTHKVPRRPPFEKVEIICDRCNNRFKISPDLLPPQGSRVYCDSCNLKKSGRA